eukprot:TRINITY_DN29293_c0_g1_i1.p1 TRINITY_DN29293_c0_g1~~TRINITY_DN29293_c0_g1_i1.p1  ORF type:complete len:414 (-),score=101.15 TRINITY_DN29293_c0_g1_i1:57-1298(-)
MPARFRRSLSLDDSSVRVFAEVGKAGESDDVLTAAALDEIRQLKNPPLAVRRTLEVMHLVLHSHRHCRGVPRDGVKWENVLRTLASDDLAQRLQNFDVSQLRQYPNLARELHDLYFSPEAASRLASRSPSKHRSFTRSLTAAELADRVLSPERVRRASTAAATLFSWAARTVEDAVPPPAPAAAVEELIAASDGEPALEASGFEDEEAFGFEDEEAQEQDTNPEGSATLTVGVWATCPQGHGLCVGIAGSPICAICNMSIVRGGDSASCRRCGFFVCMTCRKGGWLTVTAQSSSPVTCDIVGVRFLRDGEDLPEPLSLQTASEQGASACWGKGGAALDGEVRLRLHNLLAEPGTAAAAVLECGVEDLPHPKPCVKASQTRGSVFGLMDTRASNAAVHVAVCGWPGAGALTQQS